MFNTQHNYYNKTAPLIKSELAYRERQTITEKRAPTDESIRILDEMRFKTIKSISKEFVLELDDIEVAILLSKSNERTRQYYCVFILNGKEYFFEISECALRHTNNDTKELRKIFVEAISNAIFDNCVVKTLEVQV